MSIAEKINTQIFNSEFTFLVSRSSGPGGQNVNKVNSKVILKFDIRKSQYLEDHEKELLLIKLANKADSDGAILIQSQEKRSQLQNKEQAVIKFYELIRKAFHKKKIRIATRPSKQAKDNRLKAKKIQSEKKERRRGGDNSTQ